MKVPSNQLEKYKREGFLVLENFVSSEECDRLRDRARELVEAFDPAGVVSIFSTKDQTGLRDDYFLDSSEKIRFFFEEGAFSSDGTLLQDKELSINKIGHALHDLDPVFDQFSRSFHIKQLIAELSIDDPLLLQSMYIFKQPNIGGEVGCHQDSTFLYNQPIEIAGLWFALEDATVQNGCLRVIPGGHQVGLKSRWLRSGSFMRFETYDATPWQEEKLVSLEVTKGTLIILDGLLPHKSLANTSNKSRHAYTLHVISGRSLYPEDNWLQRSSMMPLRGFDSPS